MMEIRKFNPVADRTRTEGFIDTESVFACIQGAVTGIFRDLAEEAFLPPLPSPLGLVFDLYPLFVTIHSGQTVHCSLFNSKP